MTLRTILVFLIALSASVLLGVHAVQTTSTLQVRDAAALGMAGSIFTVNKFGHNHDSDTTEDSCWDGSDLGGPIRCFTVIDQTPPTALMISSDDANDAGVEVTIELLDSNYVKHVFDFALGAASDGTGTVYAPIQNAGTTSWLRVNRAFATSTALQGNIYLHTDLVDEEAKDGVPDIPLTQIVAVIDAGENQTMQACYTVPSGFSALMTQYCIGVEDTAANADGNFRIRKSVEGAASRTQEEAKIAENVYRCTPHDPPIFFAEKTDIELTNVSGANDATVSCSFDMILFPDSMR